MKARIYQSSPSTHQPSEGENAGTHNQPGFLRHLSFKKLSPVGILLISVALNLTAFSGAAFAQYFLRRGDSGSDVRALQYQLDGLRYFNGPFTGFYGEQTENAVRRFQIDNGLLVDGIYGPETRERLLSITNVSIGGPDDGFIPGFPEDRSGSYTVVVPGDRETRFKVQRIVPDAFVRPDGRGNFVQAGKYYSYGAAENLVNRLRRAGLDARVVYFR